MKRVKLILSGIAVFAVVGGALAFKAKTNGDLYCTTIQGSACQTANNNLVKFTTTTDPELFTAAYCVPTTQAIPNCATISTTRKVTVDQ